MAITETITESWVSRLGGSIKGMLVGLVLFVVGFPVLFWNEGNSVRTAKALDEGEGACISVESNSKVDPEMDGKLVHMTGKAETKDILIDDIFGISVNAIRFERNVEMYQWREHSKTTEKKNLGGSVTKTTTYTYDQDWESHAISSSSFNEPGHDNPGAFEFKEMKKLASEVSFGAFKLNSKQIDAIGASQEYVLPTGFVSKVARVQLLGNTIYVPNAETRNNTLNNRDVATTPRIGDMRISYKVIYPHDISIVARQKGNSFGSYVAKTGKSVSLLQDGIVDSVSMFASARSGNTLFTWFLRFVGFLLMYTGLSMLLRPISVLGDVLPILGDILEVGIGVVAGAVALICSLVTIAIAWVFYRPVLGVILLGVAAFVAWQLIKRRKAKKAQCIEAKA